MDSELIHGVNVKYENQAEDGLWYLRALSCKYAEDLFQKARSIDEAGFVAEDKSYFLSYQKDGNFYLLTKAPDLK